MGDCCYQWCHLKTENHLLVSWNANVLIGRCAQQELVLWAGFLMFSHNLNCSFFLRCIEEGIADKRKWSRRRTSVLCIFKSRFNIFLTFFKRDTLMFDFLSYLSYFSWLSYFKCLFENHHPATVVKCVMPLYSVWLTNYLSGSAS